MANSKTMEQNMPSLLTGYASPPELMPYSSHGSGSLRRKHKTTLLILVYIVIVHCKILYWAILQSENIVLLLLGNKRVLSRAHTSATELLSARSISQKVVAETAFDRFLYDF